MDGVTALQKHLVRVKLEHAEREAALERTVAELKGENDELKAALDDAADELDLCWAHVHQLRLETTTKFQVEERDDWRALVRSVQEDRQRLQQENARLQALVAPGPAARSASAPLENAMTSPRPPRPTRPPHRRPMERQLGGVPCRRSRNLPCQPPRRARSRQTRRRRPPGRSA